MNSSTHSATDGLSVCIPIYNYDVSRLVRALHAQATACGIPFEIVLADDCSPRPYAANEALAELSGVSYRRLERNVGRAAIRNRLAGLARFDHLIFIDSDAAVVSDRYLLNYWEMRHHDVVPGGTAYSSTPPPPGQRLRWLYGRQREQITADVRNRNPYQSFITFNVMISRRIFDSIRFDETLNGYGHEDTLFGYELKRQGFEVFHIDNLLVHSDVCDTPTYFKCTREALANLWSIYRRPDRPDSLADDIRLLKACVGLRRWRVAWLLRAVVALAGPLIRANLMSGRPSVRLFDVYRLGLLAGIAARD